MTREELHGLVDLVMDARAKYGSDIQLTIAYGIKFYHIGYEDISLEHYNQFSDFTQAVKDYINTLEG